MECIGVLGVIVVMVLLMRLEVRLFALSKELNDNREFFTALVYFGLINLNVILLLAILFLIFRRATKLIIERKQRVFGTNLRSKLVLLLALFAVVPTAVFYTISVQYISSSFDSFFSKKVSKTFAKAKEAGTQVHKNEKQRLMYLARSMVEKLQLKIHKSQEPISSGFEDLKHGPPVVADVVDVSGLARWKDTYGLLSIELYRSNGDLLWSSEPYSSIQKIEPNFSFEEINKQVFKAKGEVISVSGHDIVQGVALKKFPNSSEFALVAKYKLSTNIVESIDSALAEFRVLKPTAKYFKMTYLVLLSVVSSLVLFGSIWLGFYVASSITSPIQKLAEATKEVSLGNYFIALPEAGIDETGVLINSFNNMTKDLARNSLAIENSRSALEKSNQELNARRNYIEIVLKNISSGVISLNNNFHLTSLNTAAERLTGMVARDLVGQSILENKFSPHFKYFWRPIVDGLRSSGKFVGSLNIKSKYGDIQLIVQAARLFEKSGEDLGFVVVFDDATKKINEQKIAAWQQVAQRIAHELKNPITPIKINAQRLKRKYSHMFADEDRAIYNSCLDTIEQQVDSIKHLANEFYQFSRMPTTDLQLRHILPVVNESVALFKHIYPHVVFRVVSKNFTPPVFMDVEQIKRAMLNIIKNSLASLEGVEDPCITFAVSQPSSRMCLRLVVSDNGRGIPFEISGKIMEPNFSTKPEGSGLGLAIVNQIITDHGGTAKIESAGVDKGTKVIIELPLREEMS